MSPTWSALIQNLDSLPRVNALFLILDLEYSNDLLQMNSFLKLKLANMFFQFAAGLTFNDISLLNLISTHLIDNLVLTCIYISPHMTVTFFFKFLEEGPHRDLLRFC